MAVRSTSKAAYRNLIDNGVLSNRQRQVMKCLVDYPGSNRSTVARITGMKESSVCGRVKELIDLKWLTEDGCVKDSVTDCSTNRLYAAEMK